MPDVHGRSGGLVLHPHVIVLVGDALEDRDDLLA